MQIDPRLNDIDDCLYRVAARVLIVQDGKVLLVKEAIGGTWWALPGGGVDHGETVESSLVREVEESSAYQLPKCHLTSRSSTTILGMW